MALAGNLTCVNSTCLFRFHENASYQLIAFILFSLSFNKRKQTDLDVFFVQRAKTKKKEKKIEINESKEAKTLRVS